MRGPTHPQEAKTIHRIFRPIKDRGGDLGPLRCGKATAYRLRQSGGWLCTQAERECVTGSSMSGHPLLDFLQALDKVNSVALRLIMAPQTV
jgi:hypothetical protein